MHKHVVYGLSAAAAAAVAAAGWWVFRTGDAPQPAAADLGSEVRPAPQTPLTAPSHPAVPPLLTAPRPRVASLEPGEYVAHYAFSLATVEPIAVGVDGTLELGSSRMIDGGTWRPARLHHSRISLSPSAKAAIGFGEPSTDLERPWAMRLEPDGRVTEVRFAEGVSVSARAILAALAYDVQLAAPPSVEARAWDREERDVNGPYQAHYERETDESVLKRWSGDAARAGQTSQTSVRFSQDSERIRTVALDRRGGVINGTSLDPKTFLPYSMTIELTWSRPTDAAWASDLDPAALVSFSAADTGALEVAEAEPAARPLAAVLAEVTDGASRTDAAGRQAYLADLTRSVAAEKDGPRVIARVLREASLDERAETLAIAALVGAATNEAQATVGALVEDTGLDRMLRARLLQATTFLDTPNAGLISTLTAQASSVVDPAFAAAAGTTLGAIAPNIADARPEESRTIIDVLVAQAAPVLQGAADVVSPPAVRMAWLAALGNARDLAVLPLVLEALREDPNPLVRGSAAFSLRFQPPGACLETMVFAMATDPSIHVRDQVLEAANVMGPTGTLPLVERALFLDESPSVRATAAYTIAAWGTTAPGLRKTLADALKREEAPRVVEALRNYLEPGRMAEPASAELVRMGDTE